MNNLGTFTGQIGFLAWLWIFVTAFAIHELEEWNILHWYQRNFVDLSPSTHKAVRLWIGFVILIGIAWCSAATLPGNPVFAAYVFLSAIAVLMQNALQHVYWLFYFKQYAPGIITAVFYLIPFGAYIAARAVWENLVPIWYAATLIILIIPGLVQTAKAKNRMTKPIRAIHQVGIKLASLLER